MLIDRPLKVALPVASVVAVLVPFKVPDEGESVTLALGTTLP